MKNMMFEFEIVSSRFDLVYWDCLIDYSHGLRSYSKLNGLAGELNFNEFSCVKKNWQFCCFGCRGHENIPNQYGHLLVIVDVVMVF